MVVLTASCSSGLRMSHLPSGGDSTKVGKVWVKVVELSSPQGVQLPTVSPSKIPPELVDTARGPYRVGPSDVLIVTVWEHPELTQPLGQYRNDLASGQSVDADGTMFFPYTGRIKVAGLTTTEIQALVTRELSKVLRDPQVDIKVAAYRSKRVYVSGEVRLPGIVTIDDVPMNLAEVLNRSGGILPSGDGSCLRLVRNGKVFEIDWEGLTRQGAPVGSIRIQPGDQVRVNSADDRVAYLLGEVPQPGVVRLTNGRMNLVRALTEAGGISSLSANAAGIYVVRPKDSLHVTVYQIDGRSPLALALAGQLSLQPQDLVYVDQSGLSRWNRVFQLLVPMASVLGSTTSSVENVRLIKTGAW